MKVLEQLEQSKREFEADRLKLEQKVEQVRVFQTRVDEFQREVDAAEDALLIAESRRTHFVKRIQELKTLLLDLWGRQAGDLSLQINVDPTSSTADAYQTIAACEAALSDFPRIKNFLVGKLVVAQKNLAELERTAPVEF